MATDYIPQKDADFGPWLLNIATLATAAPATYGLTAPEAAAIRQAGGKVETAHEATDHSWSDRRIRLAGLIIDWLEALPGAR